MDGMGAPLLGISTSSFRITLLLDEGPVVQDAVRRLHQSLVSEGERLPETL
jgi:hypothetical protein